VVRGSLRAGHGEEEDLKACKVFQCPACGWRCNRRLNAALNVLNTQDERRWFSPDRVPHEVMTVKRAYREEAKPQTESLISIRIEGAW
jgi:transposase